MRCRYMVYDDIGAHVMARVYVASRDDSGAAFGI